MRGEIAWFCAYDVAFEADCYLNQMVGNRSQHS